MRQALEIEQVHCPLQRKVMGSAGRRQSVLDRLVAYKKREICQVVCIFLITYYCILLFAPLWSPRVSTFLGRCIILLLHDHVGF